jgi:hypothetical protein
LHLLPLPAPPRNSLTPPPPPPPRPPGFYTTNLLRISCPGNTSGREFSIWAFLKVPRWRGTSVDLVLNYKRPSLPAGATCSTSLLTLRNGWSPLSVTVLVVY